MVSLNANIETPADSRGITGIKLDDFQSTCAESFTSWHAYCIDCGKVEKQLKPEKPVAHCNLVLSNTQSVWLQC